MMDYIRRRLYSGDFEHDLTNPITTRSTLVESHMNNVYDQGKFIPDRDQSNHSVEHRLRLDSIAHTTKDIYQETTMGFMPRQSVSKAKCKILLVIDDQQIDWSKYFKNKKIFADYDIHVEQTSFQEISLSAYSHGGISIKKIVLQDGQYIVKSFCPDFVLIRQYVRDFNVDWINIILGMQYGAVPTINSVRALYNFRDKPWVFAELLKIQKRLGSEQFPLINQAYYPNHRKMFISPQFPCILKIGQAHHGLGKIKVDDSDGYHNLRGVVSISKCHSTIEPYIRAQCDVYIQKIGHHYRAFSRKSISGHWKANIGSSFIEQIEMNDRYRLWIDEVSQLFGGLDICAIQAIKSTHGKELILQTSDCTMELFNETQEEDCQSIADLVIHKMQIYCRPNQDLSILTRIESFDELPKLPKTDINRANQNGNIRQSSNIIHNSDTLTNLKRRLSKLLNDISM